MPRNVFWGFRGCGPPDPEFGHVSRFMEMNNKCAGVRMSTWIDLNWLKFCLEEVTVG